jgi:Ferritin-like domain
MVSMTRPSIASRLPVRQGTTRRRVLGGALVTGGAALLSALTASPALASLNADPVLDFGDAAVGAERIGIAFYSNALGLASPYSCPIDLAKGSLLNSSHREYFQAALNQETQHLTTLLSLGLSFAATTFTFPAGTFQSARAMLSFGEQLESIFIGAYLGAIKAAATAGGSLGIAVAELAGQIVGIECEHRVLIRDINGEDPPNDRFFEGNQTPGPDATLGNTGTRSVVYATGDDAVAALLALGIGAGTSC